MLRVLLRVTVGVVDVVGGAFVGLCGSYAGMWSGGALAFLALLVVVAAFACGVSGGLLLLNVRRPPLWLRRFVLVSHGFGALILLAAALNDNPDALVLWVPLILVWAGMGVGATMAP